MTRSRSINGADLRVLAAILTLLFVVRDGLAQEEKPAPPAEAKQEEAPAASETLPKLADFPIPSVEDLLTKPPRDWVVLTGDVVLVVEPVSPRPNTLARLEQQYNDLLRQRPTKPKEELEDFQQELDDLKFLHITLPGESDSPEYRVPLKQVRQVLHHEDLILKRIDLLTAEKNIEQAMELQILLERTYGNWPGVQERHNTLVMTDGQLRLVAGDGEGALSLAEEMFTRNRSQAGLAELTEKSVARLVDDAWKQNDTRRAQHYLGRLRRLLPESPEATRIAGLFADAASKHLTAAEVAASSKDFRLAAVEAEAAAAVWPEAGDLKPRHRPHLARYPRLHVGVTRLAGEPTAYPFSPRAELRARSLRETGLFTVDRIYGGATFYKTRFFNEWEPFDLGRKMQFTLKTTRQPWETPGRLAADECAEMFLRRMRPDAPEFDERLATYLESVRVNSPYVLTVTFRRVPARIESLLARIPGGLDSSPAVEAGSGSGGQVSTGDATVEDGAGGFLPAERQPGSLTFRRSRPQPDGLSRYRLAEIVEHRYDSYDRAYQALMQGDVSMVADLPDWFLREMLGSERLSREFFLQPMALPTTHLLQFNPQSRPLRNRELRRALAYALPREQILKETVLRDPKLAHGRVTNIPFASGTDLSRGIYPRIEHDLASSVAMALAAANGLGQGDELPILKLAVPPEPVEQAACERLVRAWKRVGIVVEPIPDTDESGEWDIAYRTLQSAEPVLDLWPLVTAQESARMEDLAMLPAWLQHDLVELDRITDFSRAQDFARDVLRKILADCAVIPLWEIDRYFVARRTIHDFSPVPVNMYDNADRWTIDPWYQTTLP